jgi:competence protein ComEA
VTAPSRPQLAIYLAFAVCVLLVGARFLRAADESGAPPTPLAPALGLPDGASAAPAGDTRLVIDVKGAVRRPGVYRLRAGSRALDAVRRAGGLTSRADRIAVNLAARVVDGGELVVPARGAPRSAVSVAAAGEAPLRIDLNTASAQELEQLDGVGPATAAKIVAYREQQGGIASIDQLDEVSGIGEAKLAAIRAQLGQ